MNKEKSKIKRICELVTTISFTAILCIGGVLTVALPQKDMIYSERRKANKFPAITMPAIISGDWMQKSETALLDQFPMRENFRKTEALSRYYLFGQSDSHGIYIQNGSAVAIEYPLNEDQIDFACKSVNTAINKYLEGINVYYTLAPDKSFYAHEKSGCPAIDYEYMLKLPSEKIDGGKYIDITGTLTLGNYYKTDSHWSQDKIINTADTILQSMGAESKLKQTVFTEKTLSPFYGVYYGQAALPMAADKITYLTSDTINAATLTSMNSKLQFEQAPIYDETKINASDPYDLFMGGACPIQVLENKAQTNGKQLYLFRDSFGSSLAPLLLDGYSKITVIDFRYIKADLSDYITFVPGSDALFIYSTGTWNSGQILSIPQ